MQSLVISDLRQVGDEPCVHDLRLAERLVFGRHRNIRQLIERNRPALERHGPLLHRTAMVEIGSGAKRETTEYWLNEAQALLICTKSNTAVAEEVTSEVIKIFIAWRRGELAPASQQVTIAAISELFNEKFAPVHREVASMRLEITEVQKNVIFIGKRIDDIVPRRDFPKEAQKQFKCVATDKYNDVCPCCHVVKLEAGGYQFDHYLGRELNGPEHGWIVCRKCNLRMASDATFKASRRSHFEVFQDLRRMMVFGPSNAKSRRGSPTTPSRGQGELF